MLKNKWKRYASIPLLLIIVIAGIIGLTGCDSGEKIEQIYITNNHSPRLTYVEGQDLDLSKGALTVVIDGQETLLPMTDASVSVTGYDKTKLGDQTLTVTYNELTTTFTVKVVARIVAEGFEKQYFIGDTFNAAKGKLRVAKDDATTFTVNMNDPKVSVQAFDSTTPGTKTVTAQYTDGATQYTCTFNVEVYGASDVKIVYPDKKQYYSHDTGLDFAGGYLTVTAGTNSSIVRHVDITADMVTGFDLSAVTKDHRNTPLSQEITIKYLDKTFNYTIKITYSGVTVINELMGSRALEEKSNCFCRRRSASSRGMPVEIYKSLFMFFLLSKPADAGFPRFSVDFRQRSSLCSSSAMARGLGATAVPPYRPTTSSQAVPR